MLDRLNSIGTMRNHFGATLHESVSLAPSTKSGMAFLKGPELTYVSGTEAGKPVILVDEKGEAVKIPANKLIKVSFGMCKPYRDCTLGVPAILCASALVSNPGAFPCGAEQELCYTFQAIKQIDASTIEWWAVAGAYV